MATRSKSSSSTGRSRSVVDVRRRGAKKPSPWRWVVRIVVLAIVLAIGAGAGLVGLVAYYSRGLPDVRELRTFREPQTTRVVDRNGELLGEIFTERRTVVPIERIPRSLVLSVLAAEDADFYRHPGFDYLGLVRAVGVGIMQGGRFRGTSTITQQLVKNLLLTSERSFERKIRELILARQIEEEFSKDEILGLYLNHINFGHGRYGVQEAARFYFAKDVSDLTLAEAALIAGIPQSPARLSPRTHPEAARRRQRFVLDQLADKREEYWPDLAAEAIEEARTEAVELAPLPEASQVAPEMVELARRELHALVGEAAAERGGYVVHTTVDVRTQTAARAALADGLAAFDRRHSATVPVRRPRPRRNERIPELPRVAQLRAGASYDAVVVGREDATGIIALDIGGQTASAHIHDIARQNPDDWSPTRAFEEGARVRASVISLRDPAIDGSVNRARIELGPEGAVVVLDPRTRDVLAMIGSVEAQSGWNRATQALRQPGSTFKPIVYALGIHTRRFTPASIVLDAPGVYDEYQPRNFETWEYRGEMRLREALAMSINQVAVRVNEELTPAAVAAFARELGISSELEPSLSLALGASEVRPIELANAYATFAAGGRYAPHRIVRRVVGPDGQEVALPRTETRDVLTTDEAFLVTSMLTSVVDHGTGRGAQELGRPVAGKTGTSNDARDVWFAGYTPELVGVVWVGFDDHRPLGQRESGGRTALPIWVAAMRAAVGTRPRTEFAVPSAVITRSIDPRTGLLAREGQSDAMDEFFLTGTEPTEVAPDPTALDAASFLMLDQGGSAP